VPATMPPTTRNNAAHSWAPEIVMLVTWVVTDKVNPAKLKVGPWGVGWVKMGRCEQTLSRSSAQICTRFLAFGAAKHLFGVLEPAVTRTLCFY